MTGWTLSCSGWGRTATPQASFPARRRDGAGQVGGDERGAERDAAGPPNNDA